MERSRTYECMCLLDNREVRKGWQPLKDMVAGVFTKHGAEVLSSRRWDERRLSYPIRGQLRGTYLLVYFKSGTQEITAIRRDLQFAEPVLRFLTTVCEEVPQEAYQPETAFDVNAIPDEERHVAAEAAEGGDSDDGDAGDGDAGDGDAGDGDADAGDESADDTEAGDDGTGETDSDSETTTEA